MDQDQKLTGLSTREASEKLKKYGPNIIADTKSHYLGIKAFFSRFKNPLVVILVIAATISYIFGDKIDATIIVIIIFLSVLLDFVNTYRSEQAAEALKARVRVNADVIRNGKIEQLPLSDIVPGDIIKLKAGKIIPADGFVLSGKDLFANEAALTGESFPQGKPQKCELYMGSAIVSGSGYMQVTQTGTLTKFAHIAKDLTSQHRPTEFEREIKGFSSLIIKVTIILVIFVFIVNIAFNKPALQSILFSLALAVGLTPELLPLIISLNLTKGSLAMSRHGVIVKQLSAIQNFGSMDILCTDKTGTLTEDEIKLVKYLDGAGKSSDRVLELGVLTSAFSTAFTNPMDEAILKFKHIDISAYKKADEIPFDFERKREAVISMNSKGERELIVKGAPEEVLIICKSYAGKLLKDEVLEDIKLQYAKLSQDGYRVLGLAKRRIEIEKNYEPSDESNMEFVGFLAFLDPAKKTVSSTLELMRRYGIGIKIITGDNGLVTEKIAGDINLKSLGTIDGVKLAKLNRVALAKVVEENTIFARVNPEQKMQIIEALQKNGHVVGYMGDGINDAPSLRTADVGVSVDNAVDVAKDAADFIMLRKNLHELTLGVIEGRKTFVNTLKYLRMGLSSNFGNMFSMAGASLILPFLPMTATQILLNNLLYDTSQSAIPLDTVDNADVLKPRIMKLSELKKFMWSYGLLSSIFDFSTFGILYLIFHAQQGTFQTGWFIESYLTQTLVVFIIRTRFNPLKSHPSPYLIGSIGATITAALLIALTPLSRFFHFGSITWPIVVAIALEVGVYLVLAEKLKKHFYYS